MNYSSFTIANTFCSFITTTFNVPAVYSPAISILLIQIIDNYKFELWHILIIFICYGLWKIRHLFSYVKKNKNKSSITLYRKNDIDTLMTYMWNYSQFFDTYYDLDYGNIGTYNIDRFIDYHDAKFLKEGQTINFNDVNFNVKGHINIEIFEFNYRKSISRIKCPIIFIYKNNRDINADIYFENIKDQVSDDNKKNNHVKLQYVKVINEKNYQTTFYEGPRNDFSKKKFKMFFHQEKNYLLNFIGKINDSKFFEDLGQSAQLNLILYGPPGTGKSSFIYRLAKYLNRHIVSVDLSNIDKYDAYQILFSPNINGRLCTDAKEYIIVLEEFDQTINKLLEKDVKKDTKKDTKKDDDKKDDARDDIAQLQIKDLLELLQGPIVREGQIIIATTNDFEIIKNKCPALFRSGRLTPIHFDYLSKEELQKLIKHYFDEDKKVQSNAKVPTSEIIEAVLYAKIINDKRYFMNKLSSFI